VGAAAAAAGVPGAEDTAMILSSRALAFAGVMLSRSMFMALFSRAEMKGSQEQNFRNPRNLFGLPNRAVFGGPAFQAPSAWRQFGCGGLLPVCLFVCVCRPRRAAQCAILNRQLTTAISFNR
jgi:hypothetical protein